MQHNGSNYMELLKFCRIRLCFFRILIHTHKINQQSISYKLQVLLIVLERIAMYMLTSAVRSGHPPDSGSCGIRFNSSAWQSAQRIQLKLAALTAGLLKLCGRHVQSTPGSLENIHPSYPSGNIYTKHTAAILSYK